MSVNGHDVVLNHNRCYFFMERFVCCMTHDEKLSIQYYKNLVAAISATLHDMFVRSKYANSVSQFLLQ